MTRDARAPRPADGVSPHPNARLSGPVSAKGLFTAIRPKPVAEADQLGLDGTSPAPTPVRDRLDYDPTPPDATAAFLAVEGPRIAQVADGGPVWEPAVGGGHMAGELARHGLDVVGSDIVDRGWPGTVVRSFYDWAAAPSRVLITNPPYCEINARDGHGRWLRHAASLGLDYIALLLSADWPFARANGLDQLLRDHPVSREYKCCFKIDFRGLGSPPQRNCWFVWDRASGDDWRAIRLFRDVADPRQGALL